MPLCFYENGVSFSQFLPEKPPPFLHRSKLTSEFCICDFLCRLIPRQGTKGVESHPLSETIVGGISISPGGFFNRTADGFKRLRCERIAKFSQINAENTGTGSDHLILPQCLNDLLFWK